MFRPIFMLILCFALSASAAEAPPRQDWKPIPGLDDSKPLPGPEGLMRQILDVMYNDGSIRDFNP